MTTRIVTKIPKMICTKKIYTAFRAQPVVQMRYVLHCWRGCRQFDQRLRFGKFHRGGARETARARDHKATKRPSL